MKKLMFALGTVMLCFGNTGASTVDFYGKVTSEGKGIAGVPVTDGRQIVLTDNKGNYRMTGDSETEFIYITLPDGYAVPMENRVPAFYKAVPDAPGKKQRMDFSLTADSTDQSRYVLFVWADPQVYFEDEMPEVYIASEEIKDLMTTKYAGQSAVGMLVGDIVGHYNSKVDFFDLMKDAVNASGVPFFYVCGNHDIEMNVRSNDLSRKNFHRNYGPSYYSFNKGGVHYVVLDNVFWLGRSYVGYIPEEQLRWLEQDLKNVPEGSTVVVGQHIPCYSREARANKTSKEDPKKIVANRSALFNILKPYDAHIMSGHEHYNENYVLGDNLYEHCHAPLSTLFWLTPWAWDGTPGGYAVYEIENGHIADWYYKSVGDPADFQFQLYPVGASREHPEAVVANIWNYDRTWKVRWYENGIDKGEMIRFTGFDPNVYNYVIANGSKFKHKGMGAYETEHIFYAVPESADSDIRVEVTDHNGNVYIQTLNDRLNHKIPSYYEQLYK